MTNSYTAKTGREEFTIRFMEDFKSGELSMFLVGTNFEDMDGSYDSSLVAHDIMEHVNGLGEIGGVIDEVKAIGAAYFTRYETGYNVTLEGMKGDLLDVSRYTNYAFTPIVDNRLLEDAEEIGIKELADSVTLDDVESNKEHGDIENAQSYINNLVYWLMAGYQAAQSLYVCNHFAVDVFKEIERTITECRNNNEYGEFEGLEFDLRIDWDSGEVNCDICEQIQAEFDYNEEVA